MSYASTGATYDSKNYDSGPFKGHVQSCYYAEFAEISADLLVRSEAGRIIDDLIVREKGPLLKTVLTREVREINRTDIEYARDSSGKVIPGPDGKGLAISYAETIKDSSGAEIGNRLRSEIQYDDRGNVKSYNEVVTMVDKNTGEMVRTLNVKEEGGKITSVSTNLDKYGNEKPPGARESKDPKEKAALATLRTINNDASKNAKGVPGKAQRPAVRQFAKAMKDLNARYATMEKSARETLAAAEKVVKQLDQNQQVKDTLHAGQVQGPTSKHKVKEPGEAEANPDQPND